MDKKWNLQDITPAQPRKRKTVAKDGTETIRPSRRPAAAEGGVDMRVDATDDVHIPITNGKKKKRSHLLIALTTFCVIFGIGFVASILLAGAEVTVFPRNREPNVNATFEALRTPQVGELSYEIMSLEADGERQVSATGQEEVTEQATGVITVYKTTDGAERLIKNTRFKAPTGEIFRITESAVVPGAQTNGAGESVPGSIQAKVFAEEAGENYNMPSKTRFTVPGFKEGGYDDLYNAIYAENTEAFIGGFDGPKFIIDGAELETATQALQQELRDALLSRVPSERPAGFVLFDEAITFTYESQPSVEYGENLVTIKEKALLQVPLFKDEAFAEYLAAATIPGYENSPVRIADFDVFTFAYSDPATQTSDIGNADTLAFKLTGKPHIIWTYDEGRLKTDLLGANKTALTTVLTGYPAIVSARATVRPFWKRAFPADLDEITVIEVVEPDDTPADE